MANADTPKGLPPKLNICECFENPCMTAMSSSKSMTGQEDGMEGVKTPSGLPPKMVTYDFFDNSSAMESLLSMSISSQDDGVEGVSTPSGLPPKMMTYDFFDSPCEVGQPFGVAFFPRGMGSPSASELLSTHDIATQDSSCEPAAVPYVLPADPQPELIPATGKAVSCSYSPGGATRIRWNVDSRRLSGHDTTLVSPAFPVDLPGYGLQDFKIVVHAVSLHGSRGGAGFRNAKGRGFVQLKCEMQLQGEYEITLVRVDGAPLGLDLTSQDNAPWCIQAINGGLIQQWNEEHPDSKVKVGDFIVAVNGVRGDPSNVRAECSHEGALRVVLQRGGWEASAVEVSFGVGGAADDASLPAMRGPVIHRFTEQSCCGIRDTVFDFSRAVDKAARKVAIHVQMAPAASK